MFDTVLAADRGLVTCRVVRTCQRLGARAVTAHAEVDGDRLHSRSADESLLLGPTETDAYLDGLKVIEAAGQAGAQALHPGSGVLARSAAFATAVQDAGLVWIGPPPEALAAVEAGSSDGALLVTLLALPEGVLVVGDSSRSGGVATSPAPAPDDLREHAAVAAVAAVERAGLAGLVRVALDGLGEVVVLEPWLHADAAAVELVSGVDLVEQQLRLSAGRGSTAADAAPAGGTAVLLGLRAREPGRLTGLRLPDGDGLRVEVGVSVGEQLSPADGVLLTLAAWGTTEDQARERLAAAREQLVVEGIELEEDS